MLTVKVLGIVLVTEKKEEPESEEEEDMGFGLFD